MNHDFFKAYTSRLNSTLTSFESFPKIESLAMSIQEAWRHGGRVYLCGNGGSAANAMHLANDFIYGVGKGTRPGIRALALTADSSILTCLGNDVGYDSIFSSQLEALGEKGDLLICLSGSGNSPNILKALETARNLRMKTFAIVGFSGGKALEIADVAIHFPVSDMQIAEDTQLIVGHMIMQWLSQNPPEAIQK